MKNRNTTFISVSLVIGCFGLFLAKAFGIVPAPDGGYPGGNTAEGQNTLFSLTTGVYNTAIGWLSLRSNTDGSLNTAVGAGTLPANNGNQNTAIGAGALLGNTSGYGNTATGTFALQSNVTGFSNSAFGFLALSANITGHSNTAIGDGALGLLTNGNGNTALGIGAGVNIMTANNVICLGHPGEAIDGTTWISNVYGITTQSGTTASVVVSDGGQLGTVASSKRFKKDIATLDKTSEAILALRPVTFHYKSDPKGIAQFGLIAEEVAKVNPALVLPDKQGKPYTVRYDAVNAMLLNEFLKEHKTVQELKKEIAAIRATVRKQDSKIRKVSDQLELNNPSPQLVDSNK